VNLQLAPDEKSVIVTVNEQGDGAKNTIVPNYVTETSYTEDIGSRSKVGDTQNRSRLAIVAVENGEVKWVDHGQKQAAAAAEKAAADQTEGEGRGPQAAGRSGQGGRSGEPREREVQLSQPIWSEDGTKAIVAARAADNKDRWVLALDPATGKTRVIVNEHDDAWIDGPGAFTLGWMKDNKSIYFQSERTGYAHLYSIPYEGGEAKQLTSGKWEVSGVQLSDDKSKFFLTTSEVHPCERHLYSMPADGGERTKITSMPGGNQAFISPDEKMLALIYSYSNKPTELYIADNRRALRRRRSRHRRRISGTTAGSIRQRDFQGPRRRGIYADVKPKNFKKAGRGDLCTGWLCAKRSPLLGELLSGIPVPSLMENGFLDGRRLSSVIRLRRDWRAGFIAMGVGSWTIKSMPRPGWFASKALTPIRALRRQHGGFITLMALFTQPDVFAAGAALSSDWAHYNHGYTSTFSTCRRDAGTKKSSPIYFAQNLKGALLICHGMVDTNVHFQDTVRLVQRLIELKKDKWELAVYPVEDHGFLEPTSWADEYKRIFKLFETNLKR
jgi:dipeptidyl aminopeptidase/acylaminoacyl peptidase